MLAKCILGSEGLEASALGLGCMGMSTGYGAADKTEAVATLHRALDLGVTFFDNAEVYRPFIIEELLGRELKSVRDDVIIATKFDWRFDDGAPREPDSRPAHIRDVVNASLKRLQTETASIFFTSTVSIQTCPWRTLPARCES